MDLACTEILEKLFVDGSRYRLLLRKDHRNAFSTWNGQHSIKKLSYRNILLSLPHISTEVESMLS